MKALLSLLIALTLAVTKLSAANLYTYVNGGSSGNWSSAGTWTTDPSGMTLTGSAVPGNNDVVYILNGFTVNVTANITATGLSIVINNGGTLDLSTFTTPTIASLSGSGKIRRKNGTFPTITSNAFVNNAASGATVEFYEFTGNLPLSINYPNLLLSNGTATSYTMSFPNSANSTFTILGSLTTQRTGTGTLTLNLGTQVTNKIDMSVNGNIAIGSGTTLSTGSFNATHDITVYGNFTNNGTVDFSNSTQYTTANNGAIHLYFEGESDNTFACNGTTDLYTLTVNKGLGSTYILSVTSTSTANLNFYASGQLITITTGTLKLGANIDIPRVYGSGNDNYDIGSSANSPMLWIDGATVNTNTCALVVYGKFRITNGTFTCYSGQGTVIREEGQYLIEGGTFNTEKFRPSTTASTHRGSFTMTGGTFNADGTTHSNNGYARFSLPYPEQVFIMSGGIINVRNPEPSGSGQYGGIHIGCKAANYSVTGGTVNAILSGTATYFDVASVAPFWNFNITKTGGTPTTVRLDGIGSLSGTVTTAQPLVVLNDFVIDGTNSPVFETNGLDVSVGGSFTVSSGATYTPSTNTTTFNGAGSQTFTCSGTITTGLYNLTVSKSAGTLALAGTATSLTVSNKLTLTNGILDDAGKTINVAGDVHNESVHTGTGRIALNGSTTQYISGDDTGVFGNLQLDNTSSPGVSTSCDIAVSGVLTLAGTGNSLFDIGQNLLSITSTSTSAVTTSGNGFSSAKMIRTLGYQSDKGVRKTFGNLNAFTYPVGTGTSYTPARIQLTSAPTTYGSITVRPVASRHPLVEPGNTNNLSWYWKVSSSNFTGVGATALSHRYYYLDTNVSPAGDDSNYRPAKYNAGIWTEIPSTAEVNQGSNYIDFEDVGYIDGDFTAGRNAAFGTVTIFYSRTSGNWNTSSTWSTISHTGAAASTVPADGDQVYIGDGGSNNHTITITENSKSSGGLEINYGSTLDLSVYTGHDFGRLENVPISGSGRLRISSNTATAEFPAGDFGNFLRNSGGTVEYYSTGTQDFTIPTTSATPTSLPLISYKNLVLTPNTGRYILMPDEDLKIYSDITVQGSSSTGIVRLNTTNARSLEVAGNITITSGNLQFRNGTPQALEVIGNLSIGANAIFDIASGGTATTNTIELSGNLVNNGTLDFANTASYICNTTMNGTASTSITGTGATTDFNILTINKGTSQATIVEVNASAFSLSGSGQPLILSSGTFRLTSSQTVTITNNFDFDIPATARLSANGGNFNLTGGDRIDLLLAGTLEVNSGTVNIGTTANDNSIEYAATGQPTMTITGGNLNVQAQIRRSDASAQGTLYYNQSGSSIVTVAIAQAPTTTRGVFEILNTGSSFIQSGGTLRISQGRGAGTSAIADVYLQSTSYTITGGTIELGTSYSTQTIDVNSIIPVYNVTVTGSSNTARLIFNGLTMRGSLAIQATNVFNANAYNVSVAGNFSNANTDASTGVTVGGYRAGSSTQTTTFNGSTGNQTITGVSGNRTNFANVIVSNSATSGSVSLQSNTDMYVNGSLTLSNGTLAGSANTISVVGTVTNSATHTSSGSGSITLAGTSIQTIAGNGLGKFGNLIVANTAGATFSANQEVTGTLTLNGMLYISTYRLKLTNTSNAAISRPCTSCYIATSGLLSDGGVSKSFAGSITSETFLFPLGISAKYTPASYTLTIGTSGGDIIVVPVNGKHPSATGSGTSYIRYYWNVTHTIGNLQSATHTYVYVATDQSGTESNYRDARFSGGAWTIGVTAGNPNTSTNTITFTNTDLNADYTAGQATAFVNPTTYTSVATGNWESDATVWSPDPPGTGIGPPDGSFVIVSVGHTVTVTTNSQRLATTDIRGRLHLGTTTGHDFGTVSTSGAGARTMQLRSSTFPTGNFTAFTAANGGTVEYDGTVTLPTQPIYNNLTFTSTGTKTLPNADLTLNGNMTISAGTVTNAVNNRNITLASATGDLTNNATFNMGSGTISVGRNLVNSGASASFVAGSGTGGLRVGGDFSNLSSATFTSASDSLVVAGDFTNSATFTASTGGIRVLQDFSNASGATFNGLSGGRIIGGTLTNNGTFANATGITVVGGDLVNTGAAAILNLNAGTMTISGDIDNTSAAVLHGNTGTINLGGDWNNTATFNANQSTLTLNSTGTSTLNGATTFCNMSRNNGGSISLASSITVTGYLTLNSGNIITSGNVVSLTSTTDQPVVNYSAASFVDGILQISFPNNPNVSRIYPVGKDTKYRPVTIQQTTASTSPVVSVEMIETPPTGTIPDEIDALSETRYYEINRVSGTIGSPVVALSFNTNGASDENIDVPGNARIMRATDPTDSWTNEGGSGVFSPASPAGYATSEVTTIDAVTYFALGQLSQATPIELVYFDAVPESGVVMLSWRTATELNNDYFTILRSKDGIHFDSIATLPGSGTTMLPEEYELTDHDPLPEVSYYRLKQTDFDKKFSVSPIIRVQLATSASPIVTLYPNPAKTTNSVFLKLENREGNAVHLVVTDLRGFSLFNGTIDINTLFDLQQLRIPQWSHGGMFFLHISTGNFKKTVKLSLE